MDKSHLPLTKNPVCLILLHFLKLSFIVLFFSCNSSNVEDEQLELSSDEVKKKYKTENVIIVVIDGPRYSETWGKEGKRNIPYQARLLKRVANLHTNFKNAGPTYTNAGHSAISTGHYQEIENDNSGELPEKSSIFQHFLAQKNLSSKDAWIIASKDKIDILANTLDPAWKDKFNPSTDCGLVLARTFVKDIPVINDIPALPTLLYYRPDWVTVSNVKRVMREHKPKLMLVNLMGPDFHAHFARWNHYIQGIKTTDKYIDEIWYSIQSNPNYKDKTTLIVTNDHGRHNDDMCASFPLDCSYSGHGDNCSGCRQISLLTIGPDFKKRTIHTQLRDQRDISATVAELLGFNFPSEGNVMTELFE